MRRGRPAGAEAPGIADGLTPVALSLATQSRTGSGSTSIIRIGPNSGRRAPLIRGSPDITAAQRLTPRLLVGPVDGHTVKGRRSLAGTVSAPVLLSALNLLLGTRVRLGLERAPVPRT